MKIISKFIHAICTIGWIGCTVKAFANGYPFWAGAACICCALWTLKLLIWGDENA
jgi:hypothetical protein